MKSEVKKIALLSAMFYPLSLTDALIKELIIIISHKQEIVTIAITTLITTSGITFGGEQSDAI